jgi:hypothetical protein
MSEKNPFDDLFDQISKLLSFVKEHTLIPPDQVNIAPADIEKRLDKLRKKIANFSQLSEDIVRLSGVSQEELKMRLGGVSKEVPPEGKKLIDRSREIKAEVENLNEKLELTLKHLPLDERRLSALTEKPKSKVLDDKEYAKKRRSKFKRFGSDETWKPL